MSVHIDTLGSTSVAAGASSLPSVSNDIDPDTSSADSNSGSQGSSGSNPPQSSMDLNDHASHQQQGQQQQQQQQGQQQHQQQVHQQGQPQQQQGQQQQQQQHGQDMSAGGGLPPQHQQGQQQSGMGGYPSRRVTIGGSNNRRNSLGYDMNMGDFFNRRPSGFGDLDILGRRDSLDSTTAVLDAAIRDLTRRRLSMTMGGGADGGMGMSGGGGAGPGMSDPMASLGGMGGGIGGMGNMANVNSMVGLSGSAGGGNMGNMANMGNMGPLNSNPQSNQPSSSSSSLLSPNQNSVERIAARQSQLQEQQRELERRQKELEIQRQQILAGMEERRLAMQQMHAKMHRNTNVGGNQQMPMNSSLPSTSPHMMGGATGGPNSVFMNRPGSAVNMPPQSPGSRTRWFVCQVCNKKAFASQEEAFEHEAICGASSGANRHMGNVARKHSLGFGMGDFRGGSFPEMSMHMGGPMQPDRRFSGMGGHHDQMPGPPTYPQRSGGMRMQDIQSDRHFAGAEDSPGVEPTLSTGPFTDMDHPLPLAMPSDKDWLTPLHCFVRRHCVELFTASEKDVQTPSKGKRKPIQVGQVGIRCPHCHDDSVAKARERGSVYYPTTIASIYNATMNLLQRHLHNCTAVPAEIMRRYETLKADDARSGTSKKYWVESALSLGLVDTINGIRYSEAPAPPLPSLSDEQRDHGTVRRNSIDLFSSNSNAAGGNSDIGNENNDNTKQEDFSNVARRPSLSSSPGPGVASIGGGDDSDQHMASKPSPQTTLLVTPDDEPYSTAFSYHLLSQMQPCVFTEADRLGKRKGLPPGFPGLACRHCFGGYGSGRFFPSSIKTLSDTSKTLNVLHNHMMRCRKCPADVRETLTKLRVTHDEERAKMKFGSQKAFFTRVWDRLHKDDNFGSDFRGSGSTGKRKFSASPGNPPPSAAYPHPQMHPNHHPGMMGGGSMAMGMGGMGMGMGMGGMGPMPPPRMPPMSGGMYGHQQNMMDSMGMPQRMSMEHDRLSMMDMDSSQGMQRGGDQKRRRDS